MANIQHAQTQQVLDRLVSQPTHALLIVGPKGSGKLSTATWLATKWLECTERTLTPDIFRAIQPDNKQITIEQIRELQSFAKVKQRDGIHRVIVIEQAETMAEPAQNALLKLLEEPSPGVALILLATHDTALRPTIRSRSQIVRLLPLSKEQLSESYPQLAPIELEKLYRLSGGYLESFEALRTDTNDHLATAKQYLSSGKFERVAQSEQYGKDRDAAKELVANVLLICRGALSQTLSQNNPTYKLWLERSTACLTAHDRLVGNANIKLTLDSLALRLI